MFSKTFTIACIASVAICNPSEDKRNKIAECDANNLAQIGDHRVDGNGLAQIMASTSIKATTGKDKEHSCPNHQKNRDEAV